MVENRTVREHLAKILRPGVHVGIEMDQSQGAGSTRECPQQRQGHAVVAAKRDQMRKLERLIFDQRHRGWNVAERDPEIADVGERQGKRIGKCAWVSAIPEHPACLPYGLGAETRAAAVRRPDIERDAGNADRRRWVVALEPEKS